MEIEFLSNRREKIADVTEMIFKEFVVDNSNKMSYEEVFKFFSTTYENILPVTLIALENNECLGTVSIFKNDLKIRSNYKPWLASLYVKPEYRNKSVGKKLTHKVTEVVGELGYENLYLRTEDAAEYYEKLGWQYVETVSDDQFEKIHIYKIILSKTSYSII